jgi:hypothetical protein
VTLSQQFTVKIPAGTTCTGTDAVSGQKNFCLLKVVNNNGNGPFGGSIAFQVGGTSSGSATVAKREQAFVA